MVRTSSYFNPSIDVEIDKSTGFNKQALSKSMTCSLSTKLIMHPPVSFTDIL
jgi:hypothetical protein